VKTPLSTKLYYSISEVAEITELPPYTLRAWEKEFACLRPRRARGKNRAYRQRDIGVILLIKSLLHEQRYTMQGVKQKLLNEPELLRAAGGDGGVDAVDDEVPAQLELYPTVVATATPMPAPSPAPPATAAATGPQAEAPLPALAAAPARRLDPDLLAAVRDELRQILELL
jgi:DNA-binding transcriptional MerR regulator